MSEVDISIPIPSPRGIIACTLRDAQSMSIRDMEHEIAGCRRHVCACKASITTAWSVKICGPSMPERTG